MLPHICLPLTRPLNRPLAAHLRVPPIVNDSKHRCDSCCRCLLRCPLLCLCLVTSFTAGYASCSLLLRPTLLCSTELTSPRSLRPIQLTSLSSPHTFLFASPRLHYSHTLSLARVRALEVVMLMRPASNGFQFGSSFSFEPQQHFQAQVAHPKLSSRSQQLCWRHRRHRHQSQSQS